MPDKSAASASRPARDLALIATFAGIIAVLGLLPAFYPFGTAVPITAQSLGVMLAGAVLGGRRGTLSVLLFLALVAVGLPLLSGGRGGLGVFFGPSVGYLLGFLGAAFVVGWITDRGGPTYKLAWGLAANILGGVVVLYAFGIAGTALVADISVEAATVVALLFVPGDLIKAVLAAVVARGVNRAYPGLIGTAAADAKESSAV
ncbi:MAG TPA: biotin transporter BioY [Nocardioidaceae bacterium]|nr:biotin transporter BioY [Nocardioidaceae bacterium]